jgi:hypothetical protein
MRFAEIRAMVFTKAVSHSSEQEQIQAMPHCYWPKQVL